MGGTPCPGGMGRGEKESRQGKGALVELAREGKSGQGIVYWWRMKTSAEWAGHGAQIELGREDRRVGGAWCPDGRMEIRD